MRGMGAPDPWKRAAVERPAGRRRWSEPSDAVVKWSAVIGAMAGVAAVVVGLLQGL
jgi:hypothetical protein